MSTSTIEPTTVRFDHFFTAQEVADIMRCTTETVWAWGKQGKLPGKRSGNKWLFRADDVAEYIDSL